MLANSNRKKHQFKQKRRHLKSYDIVQIAEQLQDSNEQEDNMSSRRTSDGDCYLSHAGVSHPNNYFCFKSRGTQCENWNVKPKVKECPSHETEKHVLFFCLWNFYKINLVLE